MHNFYQTLLQPHICAHYARSACFIRLKFGVLRSVEAYAADGINRQAYSVADVLQKAEAAWRKAGLALCSVDVPGDEHGSTKRLCFDCIFYAMNGGRKPGEMRTLARRQLAQQSQRQMQFFYAKIMCKVCQSLCKISGMPAASQLCCTSSAVCDRLLCLKISHAG